MLPRPPASRVVARPAATFRIALVAALAAGAVLALAGCTKTDPVAPNAMGRVVVPQASTGLVDALQARACDGAWGSNLLGDDAFFWPGQTIEVAVEPGCVEVREAAKGKQVAWWRVASIRPGQTVDLRTLGYQVGN